MYEGYLIFWNRSFKQYIHLLNRSKVMQLAEHNCIQGVSCFFVHLLFLVHLFSLQQVCFKTLQRSYLRDNLRGVSKRQSSPLPVPGNLSTKAFKN